MSIIDFIIVGILILLCVIFLFFIIAEVIRAEQESSKRRINKAVDEEVVKYWEKLNEEDKDERLDR